MWFVGKVKEKSLKYIQKIYPGNSESDAEAITNKY